MIRKLMATGLVVIAFWACEGSEESKYDGVLRGSTPPDRSAEEALAHLAENTSDDPRAKEFMDHLSRAVAIRDGEGGSCGCGHSRGNSDSSLLLDDAGGQSVTELCNYVSSSANRMVGADGGCWLRAQAVCLGALARGLNVEKIWIDGEVRVGSGQAWNFHVANVYDGMVYDSGWGMHGVSLQEWRDLFSGTDGTSPTQVHIASCGSLYGSSGLMDSGIYTEELIGEICQASESFGGLNFAAQIDEWIRMTAGQQSSIRGIVPLESMCKQKFVEKRAQLELLEKSRPQFDESPWLSASCQKKIFDAAAPSFLERGFRYREIDVRRRSGNRLIVSVIFGRYLVDVRSATVLVSEPEKCLIDAIL